MSRSSTPVGFQVAATVLCLTVSGLAPPTPATAQTFVLVTDPQNPIVTDQGHAAPHYFGSSWIDFDGDGDQDLFVAQDQLYENLGGGNFERLTDTGIGSGQVTSPGFSMAGNSWVDFDNDGDLDALLSGERSFLYENDGSNNFSPILTGVIGMGAAHRGWACAWADYNNDGALDLAITHPAGFIPGGAATENHLLLSDGPPNYTFTEVAGNPIVTGLDSYTVGSWSDYDDDGDMDYFVGSGPAGSQQPDNLYRNLLAETGSPDFERITDAPIGTEQQDGQLWNWIDYDNDGDLDGFLTNWSGGVGGLENRLYRQDAGGVFTAIQSGAIVTDGDISLSSTWGDFDNDGDLDCFVSNDGNQLDRYYQNQGDGTFTRIDATPLATTPGAHRSSSAADYDDDGDLDLFVNGALSLRALYRNDTDNGNGFLNLTLRGTDSNWSAIGAKVRVKATLFGQTVWQMREVSSQNAFNAHNSLRQHFGLGDAVAVDSLVVEWPSGNVDVMVGVEANQFLTLFEGGNTGLATELAPVPARAHLSNFPNPFNPHTMLRYELGQAAVVSVLIYDTGGHLVRTLVDAQATDAGAHEVAWNGRGDAGREQPSGVYHATLRSSAGSSQRRLVLVR